MFSCWKNDVTLENCFIANNKQNGQYLFGITTSGSFTVSNSYIDTTEKLYLPGQNVIIGPNKEISLELNHFSTELCPGGKYLVSYYHEYNFAHIGNIHRYKDLFKQRR